MKTRNKVLLIILSIIVILLLSFYVYTLDYYKADGVAKEMIKNDNIEMIGNNIVVHSKVESDTAIIFYPGGKVEHTAYLPILEKLSNQGITSVLVKMPFNLAVFGPNKADGIYELLPEIKEWYIAGHSLGGAMASNYASKNPEKINGLILLGAYIYGDYSDEDALTVYGTFNSNLEEDIHYTKNIVVIEGGNHAQFGNYGKQKGDPDATISADEQQNITVDAIVKFIFEK